MPGTKGHSGGARPNSGPKLRSWRLRAGDQMLAQEIYAETGKAASMTRLATVEVESRTILVIHLDDGIDLRLLR